MTQNNYSVVQCSFGEEETYLCVLPSTWLAKNGWNNGIPDNLTASDGGDLCYWPVKAAGYRLLEKAKKNPTIRIDRTLLAAFRCKIKRVGFDTYKNAQKEQKLMEMHSDTDEFVPPKRTRFDRGAAELFSEILKQPVDAPATTSRQRSMQTNDLRVASALVNDTGTASMLDPSVKINHGALHATPVLDDSQNACMSTVTEPAAHLLSESLPEAGRLQNLENQMNQVMLTLSQVNAKLNIVAEKEDQRNANIENQLNQVMIMLSQANAKLDIIASQERGRNAEDDQIEVNKFALNPVRNLTELEALEHKCMDERFVEHVVKSLAKIHGKHRFTGNGQTVCLQLIDHFVDRRFLREVSWTGVSKTKDLNGNPQMKIAFSKYDRFINLFFQVVLHADEMFTLEACHKFLKQCIRNSKQRLEEIKRLRMPVARNRRVKNGNELLDVEREYDEDGEDSQGDANELHVNQSRSQEMEEEFLEEDTTLKEEHDGESSFI